MEVSSILLVFRDEMQLRTEMRYYYVSISIAKIKKKKHTQSLKITNTLKDVEYLESSYRGI